MRSQCAVCNSQTTRGFALPQTLRQFVTHIQPSLNRVTLLTIMLLWSVSLCAQTPAGSGKRLLTTDNSIEFDISGPDNHPYEVALDSNEFFQVHVVQMGLDVLLRLLDATGNEVAQMNSPHKLQAEETLTFVAPAAGNYRLEVTALNAKAAPGKYTIRREARRAAMANDRRRVEVERVFVEARKARATAGQEQAAIEKFNEALAGWQELGDSSMADLSRKLVIKTRAFIAFSEGRSLIGKDSHKAIKRLEEARNLYHETGEAYAEGGAILGMYDAAITLNDEKRAIEFLKQAFPLFSNPEDRGVKANILIGIAQYYLRVGDDNSALEYLLLVHPIYSDLGPPRETAITTSTIGAVYQRLGGNEDAYKYLREALQLRKNFGDKCSELEMLLNLGKAALDLGLKAEALRYLNYEAPPLYNTSEGCAANKPAALNNLGKTYYDLGELEKARGAYLDAIKASQDEGFKAVVNNNLGAVYYAMGEYGQSLDYYEKALSFYKNNVQAQATTQTNIGVVRAAQGEHQPAIDQLQNALRLRQNAGDKNGEAITLIRLSEVYLKLDDTVNALGRSTQALTHFAALNDPSGEADAFANAMNVMRSMGDKRLAIFYGKRSVNKFQELRGAARGIEGELQKNYLRTIKSAYQHLAELLIEEGLLDQAVQILNLYRDQQFFDFNVDLDERVQQAYLSTSETNLANRFEASRSKLRHLSLQIAELKRRISSRPADSSEAGKLQKLEAELSGETEAFTLMLRGAPKELSSPSGDEDKNSSVKEISKLREALGKLSESPKQKSVSLFTLVEDEKFYVLLLTPGDIKAFSHPTKAAAMNNKVKEFLTVLSCPDLNPFRESMALYDVIFKSVSLEDKRTTLEAELEKHKPDLLLWSLGDPLDSVPMAALYDAGRKQFLVERYQHAVFTRARPDRIAKEPKPWINGIGLGTSKAYTGYDPLPGVKESLSVIFGDKATGKTGIINGPALVDDDFKLSVLESLNGKWPLVHIASHFDYFPGNAEDSVLLLGDGGKLSLSKMQQNKTLFADVELLMLSACKTSVNRPNPTYGKEIDGFAEVAQRLGANSVIATLWNISDVDAPGKEIGFYRLYREHQDWPKSEVLRQSQLNLLTGRVAGGPGDKIHTPVPGRKVEKREGCEAAAGKTLRRFTPDPKAPLAHPYYWAAFVLYGGSR